MFLYQNKGLDMLEALALAFIIAFVGVWNILKYVLIVLFPIILVIVCVYFNIDIKGIMKYFSVFCLCFLFLAYTVKLFKTIVLSK